MIAIGPMVGNEYFMIYAPLWIFYEAGTETYFGFSPMMLMIVLYWIPYVIATYQIPRLAEGKIDSFKTLVRNVLILTIIGIILTLPLSFVPSGMSGGIEYYTTMVPLPFASILSVLFGYVVKPRKIESPWDKESSPDK
ncbi:MAG: membrane protein of unknown function [Candidatus Thorarchaeota archaeon]|nr:MAG: membrane protein of unknown function [Candidatus Thorarchaeota archaeon]